MLNILGKWANSDFIDVIESIPDNIDVSLWCFPHKKVDRKDITFRETLPESISLQVNNSFETLELKASSLSYVQYKINEFVESHGTVNQVDDIDSLRAQMIRDIKRTLKINNDYFYLDGKEMRFDLNLYTERERESILALLASVGEDVPDIDIAIDLSVATLGQLNNLYDTLLLSNVCSK
jgi:hypothetical protein